MTPTEQTYLRVMAAKEGTTISKYVRSVALLHVPAEPKIRHDDAVNILHELHKIGGNLNQLAHVANATGAVPTAQAIDDLKRQVAQVWEQLK